MRTRTRVLATCLALPAGFVAAEVAVRALHLAPFRAPEIRGAVFAPSADERLGFENLPDGVQHIVYRDRGGAVLRDVESRVNAQGFRGRTVVTEKAPGTFRIACLGDSHTFGYGVGEGESWPCVLDAQLRARPDGSRFEVMNCGVNAYDAEQSLAFLELRVERFRPDLVLLAFFVNDTAIRGVPAPPEQERPNLLMRICDPHRRGVVKVLRERSRFVDLVLDGIYGRASLGYFSRSRSALFGESFEGWIRVQAALDRAHGRLASEGIGFAVLLVPLLVEEDGHPASARAMAVVESFCRGRSIPCLDLAPAFDGMDLAPLRVHPRDFHAGPVAHRILAQEVARGLEATGLLPR